VAELVYLPAGRQARTTIQTKMYFVYILKSQTSGHFYKGLTNNIDRRTKQHFEGKEITTKSMRPLKLVFVQVCQNRIEARSLEKYLKSGTGREIIREIEIDN